MQLDEFAVKTDATRIPSGTVRFSVDNLGTEPHELLIVAGSPSDLPLDGDGALDQKALPRGALIGEIEPFPPGVVCRGTFDLAPGRYTLLCNVVEQSAGKPESHFHKGMSSELTVG